ncbi:MAG: 50S ribosomal protein L23, partial [Candidatus Sumerlaeia bacterium]|nr:50S ribosomal protein L23 [Candidatus Sumerlaeia bacterium]
TEKALAGTTKVAPEYHFEVAKDSNKREIRWAVETAYGVKVAGVSTIVVKGKNKYSRMRGNRLGKRPDVKKAIVTLTEGQQIELL